MLQFSGKSSELLEKLRYFKKSWAIVTLLKISSVVSSIATFS